MNMPTFKDFGITMDKLETAIETVIGKEIMDGVKSCGYYNTPSWHRDAMVKAFVYGTDADSEYVLRAAATVMDKNGWYALGE